MGRLKNISSAAVRVQVDHRGFEALQPGDVSSEVSPHIAANHAGQQKLVDKGVLEWAAGDASSSPPSDAGGGSSSGDDSPASGAEEEEDSEEDPEPGPSPRKKAARKKGTRKKARRNRSTRGG